MTLPKPTSIPPVDDVLSPNDQVDAADRKVTEARDVQILINRATKLNKRIIVLENEIKTLSKERDELFEQMRTSTVPRKQTVKKWFKYGEVREAIVQLLNENSDKVWTVVEILEHLNWPETNRPSVRVTCAHLAKQEKIMRVRRGRYASTDYESDD